MTIDDKPNLILSLTMHADEESELEWMLREVTRQVKTGAIAGNGGGCACSYVYDVSAQTRDAELPDAPACGGAQVDAQDIERTTEIVAGKKSTADTVPQSAHG